MAEYGISIQVDPNVMSAVARELDSQRTIIENIFSSIFQDANSLKICWEGNSADAYQPAMERLAKLENEQSAASFITKALREYVADLNSIAAQYADTERRNAAQDAALPGDVFGV